MTKFPTTSNLRAALRGSVEEELFLLRELALSLRAVAFAAFQRRTVDKPRRTSGSDKRGRPPKHPV